MRISDWSSDVCSSDLANDDTDQRVGHRYFQSGGDPDQGRRQHNPYRDVTAVATHDPHRADQVPRYLLDTLSRGEEHEEEDDDGREHDLELQRSEEHTSELQSLMRI